MRVPIRFGSRKFGIGKNFGLGYRSYITAIGVLREPNDAGQSHVDMYLNVYADPDQLLPLQKILNHPPFTVHTLPPGLGDEIKEWVVMRDMSGGIP